MEKVCAMALLILVSCVTAGGGGALSYDRSVTQVNMLRSSTDTYCTIPDGNHTH